MIDRPPLPQRPARTLEARQVAHRSGSPAFALLIRVATGLDQWSELDQCRPRNLLQEKDSGRNT